MTESQVGVRDKNKCTPGGSQSVKLPQNVTDVTETKKKKKKSSVVPVEITDLSDADAVVLTREQTVV